MHVKTTVRLIAAIGILTTFIGCGNSASPTSPQPTAFFSSYDELAMSSPCNETTNGSVAHTGLENANFTCTMDAGTGEWSWTWIQEDIPQTDQPAPQEDAGIPSNPSESDPNQCPLSLPGEAFVNPSVVSGTMTDPRDGTVYRTVKIGDQEWMAENLKYQCMGNRLREDPTMAGHFIALTGFEEGYCSDLYGFYYDDRGINYCPEGWHIPALTEWYTLISYAGGNQFAGKALKSTKCWTDDTKVYDNFGNVTNRIHNGDLESDMYGFTVLPSGYMRKTVSTGYTFNYDICYAQHSIGETALFWSAGKTCYDDGNCVSSNTSGGTFIVRFNFTGPVTSEPYPSDLNTIVYPSATESPLANVRCIKD